MIKWNLVLQFVATIIVPFLYFGNIFIITKTPSSFKSPTNLILLGIILAIAGLVFWILSYVSLGKSFGVIPMEQKRITRGLYKYLNHPMYVGIWLTFFGLSLANSSWQGLVYLNLIITPLLVVRANLEEKKLKD